MEKDVIKPTVMIIGDDIEEYLEYYDRVSQANDWDDRKKAKLFPAFLPNHSEALRILNSLNDNEKKSFKKIRECFFESFKPKRNLIVQTLLNIKRAKDEELSRLASRIEELTSKAYPNAKSIVRNLLARDIFINALQPSLKVKTLNNPYENSSHQNRDGHFDRINDPYGTSQNLGMQPNVQPPDQYQQQQQFIQQRPLGPKNNQMIAKNYNDFLERQGVPAISPEDIKILRECSRESLVYRCFPITAALCTALMYTARTRQIQPRFYHYLGTIFFGYFAGKLSYRSVCEDKLIKSNSNSPFVQSIRKRKGIFVEEFDPNMPQAFESSSAQPSTSFGKPYAGNIGSSTGIREFDDHDSSFNRSKDSYIHDPFHDQKSSDFSTDIGDDNSSSGGNTSYENLRARNRSAFKNM